MYLYYKQIYKIEAGGKYSDLKKKFWTSTGIKGLQRFQGKGVGFYCKLIIVAYHETADVRTGMPIFPQH